MFTPYVFLSLLCDIAITLLIYFNFHSFQFLVSLYITLFLAGVRVLANVYFAWLFYNKIKIKFGVLFRFVLIIYCINCFVILLHSQREKAVQTIDLNLFVLVLLSSICQEKLFRKIHSSALSVPIITLGLSKRYHRASITSSEEAKLTNTSDLENNNIILSKNILVQLKDQLKAAQYSWKKQVERLKQFVTQKAFGIKDSGSINWDLFDAILLLYVSENETDQTKHLQELIFCFHRASILETQFYIPQLSNYLVYSALFEREDMLQREIFNFCKKSMGFSFRFYNYVSSFCLDRYGLTSDANDSLKELLLNVFQSSKYIPSLHSDLPPLHLSLSPLQEQLNFWDILIKISQDLIHIPPKQRSTELRNILSSFKSKHMAGEDDVLFSILSKAPVFLPFNPSLELHIHNILIEESLAFSTKERAPILVCFEVCTPNHVHFQSTDNSHPFSNSNNPLWKSSSQSERIHSNSKSIIDKFIPPPKETTPLLDVRNIQPQESNDSLSQLAHASSSSSLSTVQLFHGDSQSTKDNILLTLPSTPTQSSTVGSQPSSKSKIDMGQWNSPIQPFHRNPDVISFLPFNLDKELSLEEKKPLIDQPKTNNSLNSFVDSNSISFHTLSSPLQSNKQEEEEKDKFDDNEESELANSIVFKEKWRKKEKRVQMTSTIGKKLNWCLFPVIIKSNDDLRQEQLTCQIIKFIDAILKVNHIESWLLPYEIIALSKDSGIIEAIPNSVSLDVLKRKEFGYETLSCFFERYFGSEDSEKFSKARNNFIVSLASYSIVCYLLNIKDRHNGNILITTTGHIVHIDYGFVLGISPGGNLKFESAPFKLTREFVDTIGGENSPHFLKFRGHCIQIFQTLRKHYHHILLLVEMAVQGNEYLPCFADNPAKVLEDLEKRFFPQMHDLAATDMVHQMIHASLDHWTTTVYDRYQTLCLGIN